MSRESSQLLEDLKDVSGGDLNPVKVARLLRCSVRQARRHVSAWRKEEHPVLSRAWEKIRDNVRW